MYKGVGGWEGDGVGGWEGGGVGGGGGWEARVGLHLPIGLFRVAMSPRSASQRPRHDWRALRDLSPTQGEYQTHNSHLVPSMGPIVSVVTLHSRKNQL